MITKHFKKYFKNYLFILFVIGSFILSKTYEKVGLHLYYLIALAVFILGFTKLTLIKDFGLSFKVLKNRKLYFYLTPTIILSNILSVLIQEYYMGGVSTLNKGEPLFKLLVIFIFLNSVRTFGEEFIFRGFLLIKNIKNNNGLFWLLNTVQAFLFCLIHSTFVDELNSKIVFGSYVFIFSIYMGWLNRKFNSLLPSWIIHWMNGLQGLILLMM